MNEKEGGKILRRSSKGEKGAGSGAGRRSFKNSLPFHLFTYNFAYLLTEDSFVSNQINKVSLANLIIALGIIYGDIGTSPSTFSTP
ncbi:hypothetical protein ACQ86N_39650 [Puia sp. P3]|uniref:hypothetical protein n=1 Tax=Puia sp. P3 TaxID=3423952 RepID=UPI003D67BC12